MYIYNNYICKNYISLKYSFIQTDLLACLELLIKINCFIKILTFGSIKNWKDAKCS